MYYNEPIFTKKYSKIDAMLEAACEATDKKPSKFKESYILRDKYFPYIESFIPKTENVLFRYIAKYEDKNSEILNSPYPIKQLSFNENGDDGNIIFKCTHINRKELEADMKIALKSAGIPYDEKAAFISLRVVMYLIIRYYLVTNQPKKMNIMYYYYGYSLYWKMYTKYFPLKVLKPECMMYTINNMSYRNIIKKEGSIRALVYYIIKNRFEYYQTEIVGSTDGEIVYVLDACQSDINAKIKEIADKYNKDVTEGNVMYEGTTLVDDQGAQREDTSVSSSAESLAQKYANNFFMSDIDVNKVNQALAFSQEVSKKELQSTLEYVLREAKPEEVIEFYSCVFYIYLTTDDPACTVDTVNSLKFLATMYNVIKKGNSVNKNIIRMREIMDDWLVHGSNTFRLTQRDATKTNYRKAVYCYFILCVTMKNTK